RRYRAARRHQPRLGSRDRALRRRRPSRTHCHRRARAAVERVGRGRADRRSCRSRLLTLPAPPGSLCHTDGPQPGKGNAMIENQRDSVPEMLTKRAGRRAFLRQGALVGLSLPAMLTLLRRPPVARAADKTLNIAAYGGVSNDAIRTAWADPFEK